ncbi:DUF4834 family protein [Dysgonomonas sp. 521]|uniref:DUF4834 family protein n=1 Tax=Dysgonomonas sp. 521 TaxID=2302932 RepID=UPI0013CF8081|nr:DUF4834 family protein [Dysgonomonas sp. 521]NDV94417.1 DUF4834 family protein [Dysgonomonas sp. 521]
MTFILFVICAIVIFGVMFVFSLIRGVSSFIFGKPSSHSAYQANSESHRENSRSQHNSSAKKHRKIFSKDEGEYVKFEEVKE